MDYDLRIVNVEKINENRVLVSLNMQGRQMNLFFSGLNVEKFKEFKQRKYKKLGLLVEGDTYVENYYWVESITRQMSCYTLLCMQHKTGGKIMMDIPIEFGDEIIKRVEEKLLT